MPGDQRGVKLSLVLGKQVLERGSRAARMFQKLYILRRSLRGNTLRAGYLEAYLSLDRVWRPPQGMHTFGTTCDGS